MIRIIFSLVLYKHKFVEIEKLIFSISSFEKLGKNFNFKTHLLIHDNSPNSLIENLIYRYKFIKYICNGKNIGFGNGHNSNLLNYDYESSDIYIIVNPDIEFNSLDLIEFVQQFINSDFICTAPLIKDSRGFIQYSAKSNPTILSLLLGRFKLLQKINIFRNYYIKHTNRNFDYTKDKINSSYLSGCFLLVKSHIYQKIQGFDPIFFLHLEDADFSRKCSKYGKVIHNPSCTITHRWARGSHKSLKQMFYLFISTFKYFKKWGFVIF
tara:strand:+ start:7446 stop:8246 length:801 start_codon:yes stop_codon:yes gene_type:complete